MTSKIPGADEFTSRPMPRAELLAQISPSLPLHTVDEAQAEEVNALTYEVIRHRLWAITQEMGETLRRMSGSHVVTESNDFNFSICDELGEQVQVGTFNIGLIGSMDLAIVWTLRNRSDNPGIEDGDMFLCNDPWIGGGLHQNDAAVLAPIFHEGRLFGWTTAIAHQVDLGGPRAGSFDPAAQDVFGEALPTPPIKVVRGGVLQRDVADAWVRRSRLPHMVGLDLRAKIAANKNAAEQVLRLIDKYGADTVKSVMRRMMDDAERRLRAKLETLPEGTWSAVGYQEQSGSGDRGLHAIKVAMTKQGDKLVFDFRGTAGQTGIINCPYPGLRAGIVFTMLPLLAGDIPWAAGGLMRCFEILTDEDTITNASFPAAVGLLGRTLGVGVAADKNGSQEVLLAELDEFKYRLALHPAAEDVPREIGWIVDSPGELDRLTRRLEEAGYRREGSPEEAELRGATRLRWFTDPVGYRVELAVGQAKVRSAPARPNDGGRGITGLGHLVLAGPPLAELRELYETVLEFRLTDYRAPGLYFYRCNRTHHSIALARADTPSIHHLELEHESLDDVGRSYDRALANDVPISISLGRHTNDKAISFYVENPSGFQLEIGCGGIEIGDDWVPHDFGTSDVWGHHHTAPNPFAAS